MGADPSATYSPHSLLLVAQPLLCATRCSRRTCGKEAAASRRQQQLQAQVSTE